MAGQSWTQVPRPDGQEGAALNLPPPLSTLLDSPEGYVPDSGLIAAANVALLLGQPLLVTGEPGCGKSTFAKWFAHELGLGAPLVEVVKSTTSGRDLLYDYDALARFRDVRPPSPGGTPGVSASLTLDDSKYIRFRALGAVIARSSDTTEWPEALRRNLSETLRRADPAYEGRPRLLVLIDELDKAPRDTPNDLLMEVERMAFIIPELDLPVNGSAKSRPITVITSNSERSLPDPFLRRCVYYNIPGIDGPAGRKHLEDIIKKRGAQLRTRTDNPTAQELGKQMEAFGTTAITRFMDMRGRFARKPGTAEFLSLLGTLAYQNLLLDKAPMEKESWIAAVPAIAKTTGDRDIALQLLAKT